MSGHYPPRGVSAHPVSIDDSLRGWGLFGVEMRAVFSWALISCLLNPISGASCSRGILITAIVACDFEALLVFLEQWNSRHATTGASLYVELPEFVESNLAMSLRVHVCTLTRWKMCRI